MPPPAFPAALLLDILRKKNIPVQSYFNHSDVAGGSTLGALSVTQVSVQNRRHRPCTAGHAFCQRDGRGGGYRLSGVSAMEAFFGASIHEADGRQRSGRHRLNTGRKKTCTAEQDCLLCTSFARVFITLKHRLQILSGVALFAGGHLFRGAGADDGAAAGTAFRAKVDQVIGNLNDIQIVLDDQNGYRPDPPAPAIPSTRR